MSKWHLIGVLPNLPIEHSWDFEHHAFAHPSDERLKEVCKSSVAARALLQNFKHPFGYDCHPSAYIVSDDCPKRLKSAEALADLRNAFAVASILHGWQHAVGSANLWFPQYTDYFDLYPLVPSPDGMGLICGGFAFNSYDNADRFQGQPYPDLSPRRGSFRVEVGKHLFALLLEQWMSKYATSKPNWKQTAIFRSLAMAYRAARVPKGCDRLIFDIGVHLSLWVSAHECLTHPGGSGRANINGVLDLLGKARWRQMKLRVKRRQKERQKPPKGCTLSEPKTYVQHLYRRLYDARNDFLHGNHVCVKTAFLGPQSRDGLSIQVAPLIYSAAIEAFLSPSDPRKKLDLQEIRRAIPLENALLGTRKQRERR
jgi:hypothetical protein